MEGEALRRNRIAMSCSLAALSLCWLSAFSQEPARESEMAWRIALLEKEPLQKKGLDPAFKKQACLFLLESCVLPSVKRGASFDEYRNKALSALSSRLRSRDYYDEEALRSLREILLNGCVNRDTLFLADLTGLAEEPEIKALLAKRANEAGTLKEALSEGAAPWLSLFVLAKRGDEKSFAKMLSLVSEGVKDDAEGEALALKSFPYFAFFPRRETLALLRGFLSFDRIVDNGEDVALRYGGVSFRAACVLDLLVPLPPWPRGKFSDADRRRLLSWLEENKDREIGGSPALMSRSDDLASLLRPFRLREPGALP